MKRAVLTVVVLLWVSAVWAQTTQTYKGLEITVLAVGRMEEFKDAGLSFKPRQEGYEFAVVCVRLKPLKTTEEFFPLERMELYDIEGNNYESVHETLSVWGTSSVQTHGLPFAVPKGVQPKTLHIGDVSFNLERFKSAHFQFACESE